MAKSSIVETPYVCEHFLFGATDAGKVLSDLVRALYESVVKIVEETLTSRASGVTLLDKHGVLSTHEFVPAFIL